MSISRCKNVGAGIACAALLVTLSACNSNKTESSAKNAANLVQQGLAKQTAGDVASAKSLFSQAVQADPSNKYAHYNLGYIDQVQGATSAAVSEYQAVLTTDPKFEPALYNLAILETKTNPTLAVSLYQQAIAVAPKDASAQLNLGLLLIQTGDRNGGNQHIQKALRLNPSLRSRLGK